jgi:hypothetical protein
MTQVTVQQPANLEQMFSSPSMMLGDIAQRNVKQYQDANDLNMQSARQAADFERQKQPLTLQELMLKNQTTSAQLPGVEADSSLKQDAASVSRGTLAEQAKAARAKLLTSISDADVSDAQNQIKQLSIHPDPRVRAYGQRMMEGFSDFQKELLQARERRKTDTSVAGINNSGAMARLDKEIEAGKFKKNTKYGLSLSQRLDAETDPRKKLALLNEAATMAQREGDTESAQEYVARAQALEPVAQQWMAAQKPGQVDVGQVAGLPTTQQPSLVQQPTQQQKPTTGDYQAGKTYKGSTGTYQFIGGDPKNKANWKKVE